MKGVIAVCLSNFLAALALAQEPLTFKGFELGAQRDAFLAAFPKAMCKGAPEKGDSCYWKPECPAFDTQSACFKAFNYGGVVPNAMLATFYEGRFVSVRVYYPERGFRQLREAMVERFGTPSDTKTETLQNRMGATFESARLTWVRGDGILTVRQRGSKLEEGSVSLSSVSFLNKMREEDKSAVKNRAKDL